jgi:hypothetical protein
MNYNTSGFKKKKKKDLWQARVKMVINFWVPHCGEFLDYLRLLASLCFVSLILLNSLFWGESAVIFATAVPVFIMMFCVVNESQ